MLFVNGPKGDTDDEEETSDRLFGAMNEVAEQIFRTPATTLEGVAVKLVLWARQHVGHDDTGLSWSREPIEDYSMDLDKLPVVSALHDLERMARTTTVVETPPAEDAAFFDALAEYDQLRIVSRDLEHRKEVFRPGIPEAKEAEEAFEAAYDKAAEAWTRARGIPITTQAGLFAKLQATIRFMADFEEGDGELYEDEWRAIKADVQRITGEARP